MLGKFSKFGFFVAVDLIRILFAMAANNRDPDLDAFDKLLASKKSGPEKDKKLRDHYVGVLNERNKLKEQVAVVKVSH